MVHKKRPGHRTPLRIQTSGNGASPSGSSAMTTSARIRRREDADAEQRSDGQQRTAQDKDDGCASGRAASASGHELDACKWRRGTWCCATAGDATCGAGDEQLSLGLAGCVKWRRAG